ncbi:MAG: hypothetical protein Q4B45_04145 [Coriobacteriia bacterium]|nr:hypothetical protein [Coriobacteriia bacterium]
MSKQNTHRGTDEKATAGSAEAARKSATNDLPEGFTLALALVDAVPVALFCASAVVFGARAASPVFIAGAVLTFAGGAGKVCWKLLIAVARRNVAWLGKQMRYVMPAGFVLMIAGAAISHEQVAGLVAALVRLPSLALLLAWAACMCAMGYLAGHLDQADARSNWTEQLVNACGQAALLAALLLAG